MRQQHDFSFASKDTYGARLRKPVTIRLDVMWDGTAPLK